MKSVRTVGDLSKPSFIRVAYELDALRQDFHVFASGVMADRRMTYKTCAGLLDLSENVVNTKLAGTSGWSIPQMVCFIQKLDCWTEFLAWAVRHKEKNGGIPIH